MEFTKEEKRAIETLEIEGTENNYLEVKILLNLVERLQEEIKNNYISKDKIKSMINNFRKVKREILSNENILGRASITYDIVRNDYCEKMLNQLLEEKNK